jgi:hypothetical protein
MKTAEKPMTIIMTGRAIMHTTATTTSEREQLDTSDHNIGSRRALNQ